MKPVRGIITNPMLPDGVPRPGGVQPLAVELVRGTDDQPCLRGVDDGIIYLVENLPPDSQLRVIEPPADDEGRELLDAIVEEGLPLSGSPLPGGNLPH